MRVAVVAEWYPSPADPVLGVWAHRQAVAARDAGADVRVLAMRRPVPPISAARRGLPGAARLGARACRGCSSAWSSTASRSSPCRSWRRRGRGRTGAGAGGWRRRSRARWRACTRAGRSTSCTRSRSCPWATPSACRAAGRRASSPPTARTSSHVARGEPARAPRDRDDAARRRPRDRQLGLGRAPLPRARRAGDQHRGRAPGRRPAGAVVRAAAAAHARHRRPPRRAPSATPSSCTRSPPCRPSGGPTT